MWMCNYAQRYGDRVEAEPCINDAINQIMITNQSQSSQRPPTVMSEDTKDYTMCVGIR